MVKSCEYRKVPCSDCLQDAAYKLMGTHQQENPSHASNVVALSESYISVSAEEANSEQVPPLLLQHGRWVKRKRLFCF